MAEEIQLTFKVNVGPSPSQSLNQLSINRFQKSSFLNKASAPSLKHSTGQYSETATLKMDDALEQIFRKQTDKRGST